MPDNREFTHLSLFTGIGGIDLAAEWAGFSTVGQVEIDEYCNRILERHWPDVPRWKDVKDVTARSFWEKTKERRPFLLTGGFPCQPVSYAGKRCGEEDNRWLWPEMLRVVRELRPPWIVGENVVGLINMGIDGVFADLEHQEYECRAFVIPALAVGAWHQRERVFIVAHTGHDTRGPEPELPQEVPQEPSSGSGRQLRSQSPIEANETSSNTGNTTPTRQRQDSGRRLSITEAEQFGPGGGSNSSNTQGQGRERSFTTGNTQSDRCPPQSRSGGWESDWWGVEPGMGRVAHGVSNRVDRLRCLGNAVVPQQIYPILKGIMEVEHG